MCLLQGVRKIIFNHILQFANDKISTHQFGFMHHRSTLQQWLILLNAIFNSSLNSSQTDLIYLDFKKAFDAVAHNELLFKLWHFGITGNTWKWLHAYLFKSMCLNQLYYIHFSSSDFWCASRKHPWTFIISNLH